jgi:hypothetical protein
MYSFLPDYLCNKGLYAFRGLNDQNVCHIPSIVWINDPVRGIFADPLRVKYMSEIQAIIEAAWDNRELIVERDTQDAILETIRMLNHGEVRVATQQGPGKWTVNDWVKKSHYPLLPDSGNGDH